MLHRILKRLHIASGTIAKSKRHPHKLGRDGERLAEKYLRDLGYTYIDRNVRLSGGEIDLIVQSPQQAMVFVEVKTRSSSSRRGELAINRKKSQRLCSLVQRVARKRGWADRPLRIDVIAIDWPAGDVEPVLRHHPNAITLNCR